MATTPLTLLKTLLAQPALPHSLLLLVPDHTRRERILAKLLERCGGEVAARDCEKIDLGTIDSRALRTLSDSNANLGLFAKERVLILHSVDKISATLTDQLLEIVFAPPKHLWIIMTGSALAVNSRIRTAFEKQNLAMVFTAPTPDELRQWVTKELAKAGVTEFPAQFIPALIQVVEATYGDECPAILDYVASELQKVIAYVDGPTIRAEDLQLLFRGTTEFDTFKFIENLSTENPARIETTKRSILQEGKGAIPLLGLMANTFSSYLGISYLVQKGVPPAAVGPKLGLEPWKLGRALPAAKRFSVGQLRSIITKLLFTDSRLKNRALAPDALMSDVLLYTRGKTLKSSPREQTQKK
jgi:DNA polymerase III delta subunit